MAAPIIILRPNATDVVRCLNALTSLDIRNIASDDVLTSLVTDYFVTWSDRQVATRTMNSESDSSDDVDNRSAAC